MNREKIKSEKLKSDKKNDKKNEKKNEKKKNEKKKSEKHKIVIEKQLRNILLVADVFLCIAGIWGLVHYLQREVEQVERPLYTYELQVDGKYQIHLKANSLFPEGILEEGRSYPKTLAEQIAVSFSARVKGDDSAQLDAIYTVEGVVLGYQDGQEGRDILYEKSIPLIAETQQQESGSVLDITEVVTVDLEPLYAITKQASETLRFTPAVELQIRFAGTISVDTEHGKDQKEFSYQIIVPLGTELFTVDKTEDIKESGKISKTEEVVAPVAGRQIVLAVIAVVAAVGVAVVLLGWTQDISDQERHRRQFQKILQQHKSRMVVFGESCPSFTGTVYPVRDMESLVKVSDDLQRPICFHMNEDKMPDRDTLYISTEDCSYVFILQ